MCSTQVVARRQQQLCSACAGRDADGVKQNGGLVDVDRVSLACPEERDAAANVAGEWLDVFKGRHFGLAQTGCACKFFEVKLSVARDNRESVDAGTSRDQQRLENLFGGHADLSGHGDG